MEINNAAMSAALLALAVGMMTDEHGLIVPNVNLKPSRVVMLLGSDLRSVEQWENQTNWLELF